MQEKIKILIVDDHPVFREGLSLILEAQDDCSVVGQATNAEEALELYQRLRPDVVLMDQRLPGATGIDATLLIRQTCPTARIIIFSTAEGDLEIRKALRAGAFAYVFKSSSKTELIQTIREVNKGSRRVPPKVASILAENLGAEDLTARELEILNLIRDGLKNKQIAHRLNISETTVSFHLKNLVDKLGANDRAHAVAVAVRRGLIQA